MQIQSSSEHQAPQAHQGVSPAESGEVRQNPQHRRNKNDCPDNKDHEVAMVGDHTVKRNPEQVLRHLKLLDREDDTLP
jgi:hypothetical protein